jgi:hypothetical protein
MTTSTSTTTAINLQPHSHLVSYTAVQDPTTVAWSTVPTSTSYPTHYTTTTGTVDTSSLIAGPVGPQGIPGPPGPDLTPAIENLTEQIALLTERVAKIEKTLERVPGVKPVLKVKGRDD